MFTKYKKAAAIILALALILQPVCAARRAFAAGPYSAAFSLKDVDWTELLAHFTAYSGMLRLIYSAVSDAVSDLKELGLLDVLSLLLRGAAVPEWFDGVKKEPPPGAFSI